MRKALRNINIKFFPYDEFVELFNKVKNVWMNEQRRC